MRTIRNDYLWGRLLPCLTVALALLLAGCSSKAGYLKEGKAATDNRWKVAEIDPSKLSKDETLTFQQLGKPDYLRHYNILTDKGEFPIGFLKRAWDFTLGRAFRQTGADREVTVWVYEDAEELVFFVKRERVDYVKVSD